MQFISVVDVSVLMLGRSHDSGDVVGAICKGDTLSVLAMPVGGTLVLFVKLHAPCICRCNSSRWLKSL